MVESFDVIVVGGGPGGSACATFLGKAGKKVLLLEKARFPRDKTCGDAISGKSMRVLRELGLTMEIERNPHAVIRGVIFSSPNGKTVHIPFPQKPDQSAPGYCCRREVFDNIVFQNAKKFADVREKIMVTDVIRENGFVVGVNAKDLDGKKDVEFRAKVVVGADGSQSVMANKLGLLDTPDEHHCTALRIYYQNVRDLTDSIELHFVDSVMPGYFWIFPLENGLANVGIGMITKDMKEHKTNLKQVTFDAIANDPLFKKRFQGAQAVGPVMGWTLPFGSHHRKCFGNGFVLVGDAASLIDPFTGEGIGNAMTSGWIASQVIADGLKQNDVSESFLRQYDEKLWSEIGAELDTSYKLQRVGRFKPLLNFVVGKAAKSPKVRETISSMLGSEQAKKEFTGPLFYLKLMLS
ncbi:geranylgeranyl reductase family protein [Candidatus Micrarchaeota archaeon]|nr:geranylgeranyl reductase family protein [Candidatus Micrarchaeota archaeon]